MAVASLVLGILSIVFAFTGSLFGVSFIGAICGVVGIILGVSGKKDESKAGMAKAGFVCSVIGLVFSVITLVGCAACVGALGSM